MAVMLKYYDKYKIRAKVHVLFQIMPLVSSPLWSLQHSRPLFLVQLFALDGVLEFFCLQVILST